MNRKFFFVGLTASFAQMRRLAIVMASNNSRQIFCKDLPKVIQFLRSFLFLFFVNATFLLLFFVTCVTLL